MKSPFVGWMLSIILLTPFAATNGLPSNSSIIVDTAPNSVRPYVLPKYKGDAIKLTSSQTIRFSITANSSDGAFSLLQHNGKASGCHEARVSTPGDYGNIPPGSIHTFQLVDPDSQLTHVFHPGGFEKLFKVFSQGDHDTHGISAPYVPIPDDPSPFGPMTPREYNLLVSRDFMNGTAGEGKQSWHDGPNTPPDDSMTPYFVAKDYGPKYLNTDIGYKVIQPLATPTQTEGNFTMGTIIMSSKLTNESVSTATLPHHFALQMEEGQLAFQVQGYELVHLLHGDVAFVPAGVSFSYYATVPYTKFMYMNAGIYLAVITVTGHGLQACVLLLCVSVNIIAPDVNWSN
ncbi:hypothetical protein G4B84_004131 [Aspergillus flavus NRRL3357]|nr:uncharacterized protein G4B84_004131 [Aspergillus flavus NRRL3357]QMW28842.1 hypothetical protein G4B84_004131 [Aspergillus flavus NRRL3357]